ncbi:DUF1523 family protein [Thalassospira sp. TSL5-1]|uniref:DUF1523 family protein n=1 Tax=Thalassospira sp. TSL5-1 TaxID=1544451 RepID=UPI000939BBCD|nr:DUF1523 family protein [Thalassospira sp. TSL5-1]
MKNVLTFRNIIVAIPLLTIILVLDYALPQVDVVRAVGVEIKRMDTEDSKTGQQRTRDVYFLQTETQDGKPRVYRNEDNFLYLKFNSADLQAKVQSFATDKQLIAVRRYGWRIAAFSMFPNAVKVWAVEPGYTHIPVFNTIVIVGLLGLAAFVFLRVRRRLKARAQERQEKEEREAREAEQAAERARQEARHKDADIESFLKSDDRKTD